MWLRWDWITFRELPKQAGSSVGLLLDGHGLTSSQFYLILFSLRRTRSSSPLSRVPEPFKFKSCTRIKVQWATRRSKLWRVYGLSGKEFQDLKLGKNVKVFFFSGDLLQRGRRWIKTATFFHHLLDRLRLAKKATSGRIGKNKPRQKKLLSVSNFS